jgi:hypothetical protein
MTSKDNIMAAETIQLNKTFLSNNQLLDVVKQLLSDGWRKKKDGIFYRVRNTYTIEVNGINHPIWDILIIGKLPEFDENDWKLKQDVNKLKNLGQASRRKLYINQSNAEEVGHMVAALKRNRFNLVYDNDYLVLRTSANEIKVFKLAAIMDLIEQKDGWYVGDKRVL